MKDIFGTILQTDSFLLKIIQLYETYLVRHGYMLVGFSGSGKTTIMKVLTEAISVTSGITTRMVRLNPKALTS
jgi:dynein heavy chain